MIDIKRAMASERIMKSLTGLKIQQFNDLSQAFEKNLKKSFKKQRNVNSDLGRDFILKTASEKLFYILFYVKCYPTFDLAAFIFKVDKSTCCRWTHWFMEALKNTLNQEIVLPKRKMKDFKNLSETFNEIKEIFIDGTERPIRRPKNSETQKNNYSGKKKRHTKKNIIITNSKKEILLVSPTEKGSFHDYNIFKQEEIGDYLPGNIITNMDTGFLGVEKDFPHIKVIMPKKKPKGKNLTFMDIENNKLKSKKRVLVENALAGVKRLKIVSDIYRNHKKDFDDLVILISCGIWNYYLKTIS